MHAHPIRTVRRVKLATRVLALVLMLALSPLPVAGNGPPPVTPGACTEGWLDGQLVRICMPDAWNGVLMIYCHGYVAPQRPLALPDEELSRMTLPDGGSFVDALVGMGFAFGTTSYSENGWAVKAAEGDLNALVAYVAGGLPQPPLVLLVGASEGSLIAVQQLEKHPVLYHGALALCGPLGGAVYQFQYVADYKVVFDTLFPKVFDFGVADVPQDAYLAWESQYVPAIAAALPNAPLRTIALNQVTGAAFSPADLLGSSVETALQVLYYSVYGTYDLVHDLGGLPYNNMSTVYRGSIFDRYINRSAQRVNGDPSLIADQYEPTGLLEHPLVVMHTLADPAVPFRNAQMYSRRVVASGSADEFALIPIPRYGHCTFTGEEGLGALALLIYRATGQILPGLGGYLGAVPAAVEAAAVESLSLPHEEALRPR